MSSFLNKVENFHICSHPVYFPAFAESHPDTWFRKSYYDYVDASRELIASFVNASAEGLVLVENASSAVNSILRSLGLKASLIQMFHHLNHFLSSFFYDLLICVLYSAETRLCV